MNKLMEDVAAFKAGELEAMQKEVEAKQEIPQGKKWGIRYGDLIKQPNKEIKWLVKDWFPEGTSKLLVAGGGQGKTTLLANMVADHFCDGQVFGQETGNFPIFYLNYEVATSFFIERMESAIGKRVPHDLHNNLVCLNALDGVEAWHRPKAPLDGEWLTDMLWSWKEEFQGKGMIIVDTFRSSNRGNPDLKGSWENTDIAGQVIDKLHCFAHKSGWGVLIVHHKNRQGGHSGHNSIISMVDTVDDFWRVEETNMVNVKTTKRVPKELTRSFTFDPENNRYFYNGLVGEHGNKDMRNDHIDKRIIEHITKHPCSTRDLLGIVGGKRETVLARIKYLNDTNVINKPDYHSPYSIVPKQ